MTLATILGLAAVTFVFRGAGVLLPRFAAAMADRTTGLAPALLAALVIGELTGTRGWPAFDAKAAGVLMAVLLAALRMPLAVCVLGGALVAAVLRLLGVP